VGATLSLSDKGLGNRRKEESNLGLVSRRSHGSGTRSGASQATVFGVIETAARRLYVRLRSLELSGSRVVDQAIEAGQAGACGEEDRQQDESASCTTMEHEINIASDETSGTQAGTERGMGSPTGSSTTALPLPWEPVLEPTPRSVFRCICSVCPVHRTRRRGTPN
jgi:hypothetical protein